MLSIVSLSMGVASIGGMIASILVAFSNKGETPLHMGGVGLFGMIGNVVGSFAALNSLNERDIFKWVSYAGLGLNILGLLLWAVLMISGA